jgi:drug/metabolite transporter (DMT)-like permease
MPDKTASNHKSLMPLGAVAIALFICALFGGNQVASKIALQQFPPMLCAALAFTLASTSLWIYAWFKDSEWQIPDRLIWRLHIISAILFVLFNAIALIGLQFTLASRSSIFIAMHPFFVVIFNYLTPSRERIGWCKWLGLGLTLVGVFVVFGDRLIPSSGASWIGDSLIILASALLGLIILHIRHVTRYVSPIQATLWQMGLSVPIFWLAALIFESPLTFLPFSESWWGIAYMGLAVNAIAFVVRAELFRRYSANTISAFLFISPITGLWLSYWFLGEYLTWTVALGGAMVALGVFLVYRVT